MDIVMANVWKIGAWPGWPGTKYSLKNKNDFVFNHALVENYVAIGWADCKANVQDTVHQVSTADLDNILDKDLRSFLLKQLGGNNSDYSENAQETSQVVQSRLSFATRRLYL
jgi:hypothetical protein